MPRESQDLIAFSTDNDITFGSGTPYNDVEYTAFDTDYMEGETNGYDTFIPVDPGDAFPGADTVKLVRGVNNLDLEDAYDGATGDRIVLGTADVAVPFFTRGSNGVDDDYAVIQNYDYNAGHIQLRGTAADYELIYATLADGVQTEGHYLFYTGDSEPDLIAFVFPCDDLGESVSGNPPRDDQVLCNASRRLALDDGINFRFASSPGDTPVLSSPTARQSGTNGREIVAGMTVDPNGNSYLVGASDQPQGGSDDSGNFLFVVQTLADGSPGWTFELPQTDGALLFDATTDDSYLYAVGRTLGALPGFNNAGRWDGIILKVRLSNGELVASNQFGNAGLDGYGNVVLDGSGNLYVSGAGSPAGSSGTDDAYLVAKHRADTLDNVWRVIEAPDTSSVIFVSEAWGGLSYVPASNGRPERLVSAGWFMNAGGADSFVSVYEDLAEPSPQRVAATTIVSPGQQADWVLDNVVDSQGNIFVVGYTTGSVDGTPLGDGDAFIARFSADLDNPVYRQLGTPASDMFRKAAIDSADVITASGYTYGSIPGHTNADATGLTGDVWVQRFDTSLNELAARQLGTAGEERGWTAPWSDRVYVGGMTEGAMASPSNGSFDPFSVILDAADLNPR